MQFKRTNAPGFPEWQIAHFSLTSTTPATRGVAPSHVMIPPSSSTSSDSTPTTSRISELHIVQPPPISLLTARRPSIVSGIGATRPNLSYGAFSEPTIRDNVATAQSGLRNETSCDSRAVEDDGNLRQNLQIDMKSLVGDAVGNVRSRVSCEVHVSN